MRADMVPGAVFPDYERPDHTNTKRTISELQGEDPMDHLEPVSATREVGVGRLPRALAIDRKAPGAFETGTDLAVAPDQNGRRRPMGDKIDTGADHLEADTVEASRARDPEMAAAVLGQSGDRPRRIAFLAAARVGVMGQRADCSGGRGGEGQQQSRGDQGPNQLHRPSRNLRWPSASPRG